MQRTNISWTEMTWNPVTGCSKVSAGCQNCYAEAVAKRFWGERKFTDVQCHEDRLEEPMRRKKPTKIFVNSMSDLFHPDVSFAFIQEVFETMFVADQHKYQILTKRPDIMVEYFKYLDECFCKDTDGPTWSEEPSQHIHLGTSISTQEDANKNIPLLLQTPAAVGFLSVEPMLEGMDLTRIPTGSWAYGKVDVMSGFLCGDEPDDIFDFDADPRGGVLKPADEWERGEFIIDWVIIGCESGPNRRPCKLEWIESLIDQCDAANVPVFVKQIEINGKVNHNPEEWPEQFRRRELP